MEYWTLWPIYLRMKVAWKLIVLLAPFRTGRSTHINIRIRTKESCKLSGYFLVPLWVQLGIFSFQNLFERTLHSIKIFSTCIFGRFFWGIRKRLNYKIANLKILNYKIKDLLTSVVRDVGMCVCVYTVLFNELFKRVRYIFVDG